jgi:hypothetical protein
MVYVRKREMTYGEIHGTVRHIPSGTVTDTSHSLGGKVTEDVIGNRLPAGGYADNYFHMHSNSYRPTTISGKSSSFPVFEYSNVATAGQPAMIHQDTLDVIPSDIESATQGAAQTNPGRPSVSVPIFIAELKELPRQLMKKGRSHSPVHKNSSAQGNFGWAPFFSDLLRMIQFTEHVDRRIKTFDHLFNKGGTSGKGKTWASHGYGHIEDFPLRTNEAYIAGSVDYHTLVEKWTVCKWKPTHPGLRSPGDLAQAARFAVHGWRVSPADAWELVPWSWLADYFGNVGDYLQASDNSIAYSDGPACVMTHMKTTMSIRLTTGTGGFDVHPGSGVLEDKFRALQHIGLTATAPFLSERQLTNLVGIAANLNLR